MLQQVGKYILEKELGHGAMGSVWLSSHPGLGIKVAVKILNHQLAAEDPEYLTRFIKEGNLAASINHQNVVRVLDAGHQGSTFFLVMELVEGSDAKLLVEQRGALPASEVLELAICTAQALREAHNKGIVHRDIKPDNILVTHDGNIKLADLGIAKQLGDDYGTTMAGTTIGTPFYIAPEQAMDSSTVDGRCDIYSLGATMYHLLTGSLPFSGSSAMSILMKHSQETLEPPQERRPDLHLPDKLSSLICKMMEKNPDDRYQNCDELLSALDSIKNKKSSSPTKKIHFSAPSKKTTSDSSEKTSQSKKKSSAAKSSKKIKKKSKLVPILAGLGAFGLTLGLLLLILSPKKQVAPVKKEEAKTETKPKEKVKLVETKPESGNEIDPSVLGAFGGFSDEPVAREQKAIEQKDSLSTQTKPVIIDQVNSAKIQLGENFAIFCEFRANTGVIFSKTSQKSWTANSKALFLSDGKIHFSIKGVGELTSSKKYNDGKLHRVLVKSSNGNVELHVDGELISSKKITAPDKKDFSIKIATTGVSYSAELQGYVKFISFWNNTLPNIRIKDLFRGSGAPESADFYYSKSSYNPESEKARVTINKAVAKLVKDNPGLKIPEKRVTVTNGEISLNLANLPIQNFSALKGLKIKELNLSFCNIKDSSFLKDVKLKKLVALMLKSGSISVKHLNPEYLKEFRAVKTKVTDIYELKNFRLKTMFLDYQKGLIISIKGMPLETLEIADCQQTSFSELNKNTLKVIRLFQTKGFSSIYSLKGFKLNEFHISEALVDNIFILKDMPIESVSLGNTKVTDLSPLAGKAIKNLILPATCKELDILKTLKSLEKVAIPRDLWTKELGYLRNSKIIIEGYGTKRGWWIDWGLITRKNSDLFWKNFDQYIKSNNK